MPPKRDRKTVSDTTNPASAKTDEKAAAAALFLLNLTNEFTNFCIEEKSPIIPDIIIGNNLKTSKQETLEQTDVALDEKLPPSCKDTNPVMKLTCDNIGKQDTIKEITLQNFGMHLNLLKAIGRFLQTHADVCVLAIMNCKLTADMIKLMAQILGETKTVKELVLDLNPIPQQAYHMLLQADNGLQILSLRQCSVNDHGIKLIANELGYRDPPRIDTLEVLNLTANHITSKGMEFLTNALRTNRTLISLSLAGNKIDDTGAIYIADILKEFPLTHEEVVFRRERNFRYLMEKKQAEESKLKILQAHESSQEPTKALLERKKKEKQQSSYHIQKRLQSQGSKLCSAVISGSHMKLKEGTVSAEEASSQYSQSESPMNVEDCHPFIQEVKPRNLALWCTGNLHLNHLNLAYNLITSVGVFAFLKAIKYQEAVISPAHKGLLHISLHGNPIPDNCFEYPDLVRLIDSRFSHFYSDANPDALASNISIKQNVSSQ